jgi:hypothetical protein
MKFLSVLLSVIVSVLVGVSCRTASEQTDASLLLDSSAAIQPLPQKNERHEMCGIESYRSQAHSLCGVRSYHNRRTEACGVESYRARADLACPGSISADQYVNHTSKSCRTGGASDPDACRAGYRQFKFDKRTETCCGGPRCDFDREADVEKWRHCQRDESLQTCRLPQFGVENYNACRHQNHGVETWNTCARPEFGVDKYKQCQFYLTPAEVDRYLASVNELLPYMGETAVNSKAMYFVEAEDEASMACHIGKYNADPLFDAQMTELKTIYEVRFGRAWAADLFNCAVTGGSDINAESCPDTDTSRKCKSVRSYRGARKWLDVKQLDLTRLQSDVAARADQRVNAAVKNQLNAVRNYEK